MRSVLFFEHTNRREKNDEDGYCKVLAFILSAIFGERGASGRGVRV